MTEWNRIIELDYADYHKLIAGQKSGIGASVLRIVLSLAGLIYGLVIRIRNSLYHFGILKQYKVNAAVVSIGNITAGGTGKTPLVINIAKNLKLKTQKCNCAILTRGYKSIQNSKNEIATAATLPRNDNNDILYKAISNYTDEPLILAQSCPEAKVIVNPDRVAGAKEAIEKYDANVLVLDDGFQHRRLKRDLDIIAIDATVPFGYGKMLPAGLLREPVDSLKRAQAVVITRSDMVGESELIEIEKKIKQINPSMEIAKTVHKPVCVKTAGEKTIELPELKNKKAFAFCAIGNPESFLETLKKLDVELVEWEIYDDHYHYTKNDVEKICSKAENLNCDIILCTQKDYNKLTFDSFSAIRFGYLAVEIEFIRGQERIRQLIEKAITGKIL